VSDFRIKVLLFMTPLVLPVGHVPLADGDDASTARSRAEQNVVPHEDRAENPGDSGPCYRVIDDGPVD